MLLNDIRFFEKHYSNFGILKVWRILKTLPVPLDQRQLVFTDKTLKMVTAVVLGDRQSRQSVPTDRVIGINFSSYWSYSFLSVE